MEKRSCYNCKHFNRLYAFFEDGTMRCMNRACYFGSKVDDGSEAQSCYRYQFSPISDAEPEQIKPAELLVALKMELNYLKDVIAEIDKFYSANNSSKESDKNVEKTRQS